MGPESTVKINGKRDAGKLDYSPRSIFQYSNIQILNIGFFSLITLIELPFTIHLHIISKLK